MSTEAKTDLVRYQDENQIGQAGTRYKEQVESLRITSRDSYLQMAALVKICKNYLQGVKDFFEKLRQKTYDAWQEVVTQTRNYSKPFQDAETIGKQRMRGWEELEAQRHREAAKREEERRKAAATEARKNGDDAKAERIETALPVQRENRAHVDGVQYVDNWKGLVVDMPTLLKAVLAEKAPPDFVMVNESAINKFARATGGKVSVSGIEWFNEKTVKVRV
jgi:hypothetical protein